MLILQDATDRTEHEFHLTPPVLSGQQQVFTLTSPTYNGVSIPFILQPPAQNLPAGYTVSVHLLKNPFHIQSQVIDLRTGDRLANSGKIGIMFNLEALFTPGALQLDEHRYCYAYFGVVYLFQNAASFQTKDVSITGNQYSITDFFDDDTIILVLCNEFCNEINGFNLHHYLPNLFTYGFKVFEKTIPIETENTHPYLKSNYDSFTTANTAVTNGVYPLKLEKAKLSIAAEAYVVHLYTNLIQKKFDHVTRFLMLYQVVEIFMPKMIHLEVAQRMCSNISALTSDKLKDLVIAFTKQIELITALLSRHAIPPNALTLMMRQEILDFFIHIQHPEFADHTKHANLSLADLFYAFRNKIVHEYRILHTPGVDSSVTNNRVESINQLSEALISETITAFVG